MEVLQDIAYILTRYQVREVAVLTNPEKKPTRQDNRYWDFYTGLREKRWKTEEEAARYFDMEPGGKNFNRLKNELKKRLLSTIFFIDVNLPDFNDYSRGNLETIKEWAVARILLKRGALKAFLDIAYKCLKYAQKFENIPMVVEIVRVIKSAVVTFPGLNKDFPRLKHLFEEYQDALQAEIALQNAYEDFLLQFVTQRGFKVKMAPEAEKLVIALSPLAERYDHVNLQTYYRIIFLYSKTLRHDWKQGLRIADEALAFLESKPFTAIPYVLLFVHQKMGCLIMLERYAAAKSIADKYWPLAIKGTSQWFKNRELATVNALYAEEYKEAWEICKMALRHERFLEISAMDQESWRVYHGYLHFLARTGKLALSPREKGELTKFRLQAWLNDLPLHSQDKRGANIPVLILQSLFLLLEGRWDEFDNRVEALRKYRQRNLDPQSEHFRTECFIRLLELIPKNAYHSYDIGEHSKPVLDLMDTVSTDILDQTFEIEVVPYSRQWAWMMEMMEMQQTDSPEVTERMMSSY